METADKGSFTFIKSVVVETDLYDFVPLKFFKLVFTFDSNDRSEFLSVEFVEQVDMILDIAVRSGLADTKDLVSV